MSLARTGFAALLLMMAGCAAPPPPAAEAPPPPKKVEAPLAKSPEAPRPPQPPAARPPEPPTTAQAPVAKPAASPGKPATSKPAAKPAPVAAAKPSPPAVPSPPPLDLKALERRLKESDAIGVMTKLSLKNQVDDLIERFRAFHAGSRPPTLAELRPAFELLLMKVLSLLQDRDTTLARDINASRDAIWGVLADRQKLAGYL